MSIQVDADLAHGSGQPNTTLKSGALSFTDVMISGLANVGPAMCMFFSMGALVATIGKAVSFEMIVALVVILTLGNTLAQFAKKVPSSGSFITYVGQTFGPKWAATSALTMIGGYIIAIAGVFAILGGWVSTLLDRYAHLHVSWMIIMVVGALLVALMTVRGVKVSARWAIVMFAFEALVLVVLDLVILFHGGKAGLSLQPLNPMHTAGGWNGLALGFPLVVFLFVGWENPGALAEETANPKRNVPRAVFTGITIIALLYVLTSYSSLVGYGLSTQNLTAFGNDAGPFDTLAGQYLGSLRVLVDIAGLTSIFACLIAATNSQTRILYNAGREGLLPKGFSKVSKAQTPYVAVLTYISLAVLIVIVFGYKTTAENVFGWLTTLGTIPLIIMYILSNVAVPVYYIRHFRQEFSLVKHLVVPGIGVLTMLWPFWGLVQPGQEFPFNTFPWITLGLIVVSVIWTVYLATSGKLSAHAMQAFRSKH